MNLRLKSLAYRMLGSVVDAEDVVQEAQLRLHQSNPRPDNEEAFLYRVVSNLCVDKLRRDQVQRKAYFGPWLSEPLVADDAELIDMAEQLSIAFLLMLERLSPAERIVYVLREGFDFSFAEIADLLGVTTANARQRARRARLRLQDAPAQPVGDPAEQRAMLEAMLMSVAQRDVDKLVSLMSDDVVVFADGGGVVSAAIAPVYGPARIAQVTLHLAEKAADEGALDFSFTPMNGGWGLVIKVNEHVHSCFQVAVEDGLIAQIYVVRNPEKLKLLQQLN